MVMIASKPIGVKIDNMVELSYFTFSRYSCKSSYAYFYKKFVGYILHRLDRRTGAATISLATGT